MAIQRSQQVSVEFDVPARMRDGAILRANVYRPAGEGQWPVLLTRLPYGKDLPLGSGILDPTQAARRGYVIIVQDTRGRFTSEGEWVPMREEALDGVDTIEWASQLPYSNGVVGMYGASYFGFTQWSAALHQPPALKAMVPFITWCEPLNGLMFRGGALELGVMASWHAMMGLDVLLRRHRGDPDPRTLGRALYGLVKVMDTMGTQGYWSLPLKEFAPLKQSEVAPAFFDAFEHTMDNEFLEPLRITGKQKSVTVPTLNIGGWYDIFLQDTIANFLAIRSEGATPEARQSKLLIGPWTHGGTTDPVGEMSFGFAATAAMIDMKQDIQSLQLSWFDHFLKGSDTGILKEAPIKLFVMGANVWRDEQEWPLARAVETRYYLHSNGRANSAQGDGLLSTDASGAGEDADHYTYDPANPVPTRGGATLMTSQYPSGPFDQRAIEAREDVLVYSTPVLEEDVEVTGPISVHLWAASSATDTDFVARLVDVHPDGFAQNLTDGIIRARYRDFANGNVSLIEPDKAYEYTIDLWSTSNLFKQGHRIRVDVTSSSFPRWDRNPNTGHDFGESAELTVAQQTILHDAEHPSSIVLPLVPRS